VLAALEVALVAALAVQAARLTWTLAAPSGPIGRPAAAAAPARPAADLSILAQFDPFFRGQAPAVADSQPAASGGFTLYGVRALPGGRGSAILGSADQQRFYDVGDEVEAGLVLAVVGDDHVILRRGAVRQRIGFPRPAPGAAVLPMAAAASAPALAGDDGPAVNLKRLLDQTTLLPRMRDGQPAGYQVIPRGSGDALRQAGLQRGDVLLAVDGVVLTPERVSQLSNELSQATGAELRLERNGQVMTTRIRMAP
jgi:general secretion pathway protein C